MYLAIIAAISRLFYNFGKYDEFYNASDFASLDELFIMAFGFIWLPIYIIHNNNNIKIKIFPNEIRNNQRLEISNIF